MSLLRSSVSGLQQLLSSASSSLSPNTARGQRQLESVTEEAHTHDLLYPDGEILHKGQHHAYPLKYGDPALIAAAANSSDDRGGLDIQSPRDVRIIIAQDSNVHSSMPRVLYDSNPPLPSPMGCNGSPENLHHGRPRGESMTAGGSRRSNSIQKSHTAPHTRQSSLSQTAQALLMTPSTLSPVNELGNLFGNTKTRSSTERPTTSDGDTLQYRMAKEAREETETLLECMFGAAGFPSVASTKLHVRPPKADVARGYRMGVHEEPPSPGPWPRKRTPLTRSTTAADLQSLSITPKATNQSAFRPNSSSILITRLFSVDPLDPEFDPHPYYVRSPSQDMSRDNGAGGKEGKGIPTPSDQERKKQIKTPTYAVAVLLQMPAHRQRPSTPHFTGYASINPHSFPPNSKISGSDSTGDIDYVIAHWNMLTRSLSCLEMVARCKISNALSMLDVPNMGFTSRIPTEATTTGQIVKPQRSKQTQITLQLPSGALQQSSPIKDVADHTSRRIALALRIRRTIPGQGRWALWREEARWVGKWAGGREQNSFLFNLLTAFLGSHTEWLDLLEPLRRRRPQGESSLDPRKGNGTIRHRTVIVSLDKMAARRLIFLLSAFLPCTQPGLIHDSLQQSVSGQHHWGFSSSPPLSMLVNQEHLSERSHQPRQSQCGSAKSPASHSRAVSFSESDFASEETVIQSDDITSSDMNIRRHNRKTSDARSIRSIRSAALPISFNSAGSRKSSSTTTATMVPDLAYFRGTAPEPRPGSSGSLAPLSLQRTLSRSDSNEINGAIDSRSPSRTDSWLSGFWSSRRDSSTGESDLLASSEEGLGISCVSHGPQRLGSGITLSQMVKEVGLNNESYDRPNGSTGRPARRLQRQDSASTNGSPPKDFPRQLSLENFPLKLSINDNDGVIDIELPPASYSSSAESRTSSPIALRSAASSFNNPSSSNSRISTKTSKYTSSQSTNDVAGWLRTYHQDFPLQAVRPYDSLKEDIKQSMRTEPTPTSSSDSTSTKNDWTDICTTLVANTSKFTVTRLTLRRRNAASTHHQGHALLGDIPLNRDEHEVFIEEQLTDTDPTLIDAIEKVLAQSGQSSRVASRAPSPTRSMKDTRGDTTPRNDIPPGLEVPRSECQKMVLGALQQVVKSVSEELANSGEGQRRRSLVADNALREGVRRCLSEAYRE